MKYNNSACKKILYFAIPMVMFLIVCMSLNITPFGDESLLISDMWNQYADYFGYYKSILSGENDVFYTLSKSLGGDMTGFAAYYLMSPLNLIFGLVQNENIASAVTWVVALKIGLCGLFCGIYLENIRPKAKYIWIFSTSYAFMSYNMAYVFNTMWTDGVYILPIVALGIEKLIDKKGNGLYIFSLVYALIVNYYIGYMICIFSVIYYLYRSFVLWDSNMFDNFKSMVRFGVSSLLAGGISAIVLIPVFKSLSGTKAVFDASVLKLELETPVRAVLLKLFTGTISMEQNIYGLPNIYCGLLVTVLVVIYFVLKGISLKEKLLAAAVVVFMVCSFCVTALNLSWHGFNYPAWFPYRYSFVFSFFMIYLAFFAWNVLEKDKDSAKYIMSAIIILGTVVSMKQYITSADFVSNAGIVTDLVFIIVILVLLFVSERVQRKQRELIIICVVIIQLVSIAANAMSIEELIEQNGSGKIYAEKTEQIGEYVGAVKDYDKSLYRMDNTFNRTHNDPMQFAYNGISHFSSTQKQDIIYFVGNWGFSHCNTWTFYGDGSTVAAESFLGIKYILTDNTLEKPYNILESDGDIIVYQNQYVLPLAFVSDKKTADTIGYDGSKFIRHNKIYSAITGQDAEIFYPVHNIEICYENLEVFNEGNGTHLIKIDDSQDAYIKYDIVASSDDMIYIYIGSRTDVDAELFVNDVYFGKYLSFTDSNICPIGKYSEGETVEVKIKLNSKDVNLFAEAFYHENIEAIEKCVNIIKSKSEDAVLKKISSSNFEWRGELKEEGVLVFTIPNESGWHAYVDGEEVEVITCIEHLIGINLSKGEHIVEIRYIPVGLKTGALITLMSLIAYFVFILTDKIIKKNK